MARKTVLEYPAEATPADNHILYLINGLTDRNLTLRKLKDYLLGGVNRLVKDTPETDSGSVLTANGVNNLIARVGSLYVQYPFMPTPDEFYGVGTWLNISSRAVGYGISDVNNGDPTSFISREATGQGMDFADSDMAVDDQIVGGTYDGKYVRSVESYAGLFFRVEGGNAWAFECAIQPHQIEDHDHLMSTGFSDVSAGKVDVNRYPDRSGAFPTEVYTAGIKDGANHGVETNPINRTSRIWIRTV
jgi:hypothetical protein